MYVDCFEFIEEEVFFARNKYGMQDKRVEVKKWHDGFLLTGPTPAAMAWWMNSLFSTIKKRTMGWENA
jgi:hypothetical protein